MTPLYNIIKSKNFISIFFSCILSLGSTIAFCVISYTHYIEKNIINDRVVSHNSELISTLEKKIASINAQLNNIELEHEKIDSNFHTMELKLSTFHTNINNLSNYQQTLRVEVKTIAENKMNVLDFWRIINNILTRIRWLEDHKEDYIR